MSKPTPLSTTQRVSNLKKLVEDAHKLGFNCKLTSRFETELNELQAVLEDDKVKKRRVSAELKVLKK